MSARVDFDRLEVYRTLAGITAFVNDVQDRFPEDELPLLFNRMRTAAISAGAELASGFARDGLDEAGRVSVTTQREVRARLSELRHYVLTAAGGFILDDQQVARFETLYDHASEALAAGAEPR